MSALGGAISLYLGISLAMVFEVLELIISLFINCFKQQWWQMKSVLRFIKLPEAELFWIAFHPKGNPSSPRPWLGWLEFRVFHWMLNSAWADVNSAEAPGQLGEDHGTLKWKSAQPRSTKLRKPPTSLITLSYEHTSMIKFIARS